MNENQAPYVPGGETLDSYHCPSTKCDQLSYLKPNELGREHICPKCGLTVTIGVRKRPIPALIFVALCAGLIAAYFTFQLLANRAH